MSESLAAAPDDSVIVKARFSAGPEQRPVAIVAEPGKGLDNYQGEMVEHDIRVVNGRAFKDQLELDVHGFALTETPTAVRDFYDDEEVKRLYYPEMEKLVAAATGASKVVVFDHTIRVDDRGKMDREKVRAPVTGMHNDFTRRSAPQRVRDLLPPDEAEARLKKRYGSINVWRPIVSPVETRPLAICSFDSIADKDLVAAERHYPDGRIGGIYYLVHNPAQRWFYFPRMAGDEVILLKCYDSLEDGTARWTAHGSFEDPNSPANPIPRESIEIRTLYFFD